MNKTHKKYLLEAKTVLTINNISQAKTLGIGVMVYFVMMLPATAPGIPESNTTKIT
jgi:hypothetical protein